MDPSWRVWRQDTSQEALGVAREKVERLKHRQGQ